MDISVIIVSYNTADLIAACLESVFASQEVSLEVFVVDNASKDGSAEFVRGRFPTVHLIANDRNLGFGAANNQALRECTGRYVIFLNPDTRVDRAAFAAMARFMTGNPRIGLAGPKIFNPDGSRQDSVSVRYPGHRYGARELGPLPGKIACVMGSCQIASTSLLRELGGFDEDFFLYGEDEDLCLRIRKRGLSIGFVEDAVIMHYGGQSERDSMPEDVVRKKVHAEYLFYRKHYLPGTGNRICTAQRRRARWRLFIISLLLPFSLDKVAAKRKLSRYRVVLEEVRAIAMRGRE